MKKHLMIFAVALLAISIAAPAFAAVEFKYGGSWRVRWFAQDNIFDGTDKQFTTAGVYNSQDNRRMVDQRLRLFFTFEGSKNLKVVTAFEMGDAIWGQGSNVIGANNTGQNLGANLGGDSISIEVKSAYVDFNIPNTPVNAKIGLQPMVVLDSWILGDDIPAAVFAAKLDPFTITVAYAGIQNGWERAQGSTTRVPTTDDTFNVDDFMVAFDYAQGPFKASLIGLLQFGHDSTMSLDPATLNTPNRGWLGGNYGFLNGPLGGNGSAASTAGYAGVTNYGMQAVNNYLFDLGLNLTYKVDWLLAYVNFVKNLGGVDLRLYPGFATTATDFNKSIDYSGWMIDAGVTYFCGPWTANIGGFYTSGPSIADNLAQFNSTTFADGTRKPFRYLENKNASWFTYPSGVSKATSEIIGGGILGEDLHSVRGYSIGSNAAAIGSGTSPQTVMWRGYYNPMNIWTITAGGSYQITPSTKASLSYWYWGTSSSVPVGLYVSGPRAGQFDMSSSIGHELNLYIDQKIVDGLTLTLVGAYLFADDAFAPLPTGITSTGSYANNPIAVNTATGRTIGLASDAFEVGARLQWNF